MPGKFIDWATFELQYGGLQLIDSFRVVNVSYVLLIGFALSGWMIVCGHISYVNEIHGTVRLDKLFCNQFRFELHWSI